MDVPIQFEDITQKIKYNRQGYTLQIYKICLFLRNKNIVYHQNRLLIKSTSLIAISNTSCIIFLWFL